MGRHYTSADAVCPFYKCEDGLKIHCEGVKGTSAIHLIFETSDQMKEHKNRFCCDKYKRCDLAQMHNKRWDDGK